MTYITTNAERFFIRKCILSKFEKTYSGSYTKILSEVGNSTIYASQWLEISCSCFVIHFALVLSSCNTIHARERGRMLQWARLGLLLSDATTSDIMCHLQQASPVRHGYPMLYSTVKYWFDLFFTKLYQMIANILSSTEQCNFCVYS